MNVSDCIVKNTEVVSQNSRVGGFWGCLLSKNSNNILVKNCFVNDSKVSGKSDIGGFLGHNDRSSYVNTQVTDCGVVNTSLKAEEGDTGGFVGYSNGIFKTCSVASITIEANTDYIGGFFGFHSNGNVSIVDSCSAEDINIKSKGILVGGFGGYCGIDLKSCYVTRANIKATGNNSQNSFGGFAGYCHNMTLCYADKIVLEGKTKVGGLLGYSGYNAKISKCFVKDSEIKAKDECVGGLIGYIASSTVDSCYVTGCSIESEVDTIDLSGLIGSNIADISYCYMYNSTLIGKADYGALIGVNGSGARTPVISDCFISQNHDILINTNYKNAPVNCYYNVNDLGTFISKTWSAGAWSNFNTSVFPPKLTDLPEP